MIANDVNNPDGPTVGPSFALVDQYLHLLTTADMPTLALHASGDSRYPLTGLENGVYTDGNAAALIGRSADALFVSFRGTNDVDGVIDTLLQNTPSRSGPSAPRATIMRCSPTCGRQSHNTSTTPPTA